VAAISPPLSIAKAKAALARIRQFREPPRQRTPQMHRGTLC